MALLELLALVGALQGTVLLVLIVLRYRRRENVPLALLLLVFSLRLGTIPTWNPETLLALPWLFPVTTPLPFLFGPLLWRYAHRLTDESGVGAGRHFVPHLLPYAADLLFTAGLLLTASEAQYGTLVEQIFAGSPPAHLAVRNGAKVLVNAVYCALAVRLAFRRAPGAELTQRKKLWLRVLVVAPLASLLPFAVVALVPAVSAGVPSGSVLAFNLLAAAMALLIYAVSFLVLAAPEIPSFCGGRGSDGYVSAERPPRFDGAERRQMPVTEEHRAIACKADALLATGAFLDPELSLEAMAQRIGVHPNRLSRAVNCVQGVSFPALIQHRRIQYFVEQARRGALADRTILELAFDAGFSSKSTFNRVFRAATGVSPSTFVRSQELTEPLPES